MAERSALTIQSGGFREIQSADTLLVGSGVKSETSGLLVNAQSGTLSLGTQSATTAIAVGRSGVTSAVTGTFSVNGSNIDKSTTKTNLIINGNFDIWQRGTTFTSVANNTYTTDRFRWIQVGTGVVDISRDSGIKPTVAESGVLSNYSLKIDVTTADASIAAGDAYIFGTSIEGNNFRQIAQKSFTLSFWVYATKTGTYCVTFRNTGVDRSYIATYSISSTNTWEKKTINVSASPTAGTWDYTNGTGLSVFWTLAAGSTFQTTAGAWQTGNFLSTSAQVNGMDSASNNFYLSQIQVEKGDTATDFEIRDITEEMALCQRYYWKTFPQATAPAQNAGTTGAFRFGQQNTGSANWAFPGTGFPVIMRTAPTMTSYNPSNTNAQANNNTAAADYSNTTPTGTEALWYFTATTPAGGGQGQQSFLHLTANAEL